MPNNWATFRLQAALTFTIIFLAFSLLQLKGLTGLGDGFGLNLTNAQSKDFYWVDVEPTHELIWHSCYQPLKRECARLLVPLNHLNHSDENPGHAAIALIRVPSPLNSHNAAPHPRYRGPILFNPGGPGGSGVDLILRVGDLFAQVLGDEFDIVGFDPRGVGRSTPKVMFFDGLGRGEREVWGSSGLDVIRGGAADRFRDLEGENGKSLETAWAHAVASNVQAGERAGEWLGNVNTEQTAHDMLSIVRAHGREKLMYWGFSYGTVLGSTFASLFPEKIERIIIDGVVDVDNYYETLWSNNLLDTDETLNQFFKTCHAAGPSSCGFWAPSPSLIAANLTRLYEDIIRNPIAVRTENSYGILDYSKVRGLVFLSLYSPWSSWPYVAQALGDLGGPKRDPYLISQVATIPTFKCACSGSCGDKETREKELQASLPDAQTAILCSDGLDVPDDVISARSYFDMLSKESEWADVWANIRLGCSGWPKAKKGYQGPVGGNTSFPMMLIGNTADPVTPVAHARKISTRFPGSRVLTQNSPGHCSINAPSVCTLSYVRKYFLTGELPPEGTVCEVDSPPFPTSAVNEASNPSDESSVHQQEPMEVPGSDGNAVETDDAEVKVLTDTAHGLSKAWKPFNHAFLRQF